MTYLYAVFDFCEITFRIVGFHGKEVNPIPAVLLFRVEEISMGGTVSLSTDFNGAPSIPDLCDDTLSVNFKDTFRIVAVGGENPVFSWDFDSDFSAANQEVSSS
jgi:hypothetical protein